MCCCCCEYVCREQSLLPKPNDGHISNPNQSLRETERPKLTVNHQAQFTEHHSDLPIFDSYLNSLYFSQSHFNSDIHQQPQQQKHHKLVTFKFPHVFMIDRKLYILFLFLFSLHIFSLLCLLACEWLCVFNIKIIFTETYTFTTIAHINHTPPTNHLTQRTYIECVNWFV